MWVVWIFNMRNVFRTFGGSAATFPIGSVAEFIIISIILFMALLIPAANKLTRHGMREKLIAEMRSIAREPVPDMHDPRFKKWNFTDRLPRSAYEEMAERVRVYPQRVADAERGKG